MEAIPVLRRSMRACSFCSTRRAPSQQLDSSLAAACRADCKSGSASLPCPLVRCTNRCSHARVASPPRTSANAAAAICSSTTHKSASSAHGINEYASLPRGNKGHRKRAALTPRRAASEHTPGCIARPSPRCTAAQTTSIAILPQQESKANHGQEARRRRRPRLE